MGSALYQKELAIEHLRKGQCRYCTQPLVTGRAYCAKHIASRKAYAAMNHRQKIAEGKCGVCHRHKQISERQRCSSCADKLRQKNLDLKRQVIRGYGGKCECCGETIEAFLTVDHRHDDGEKDRKQGLQSGRLYRLLIHLCFPRDRFQLLCFNCNCGRRINKGVCPHQEKGF